jgi:hypothetical protein
MVSNIKITLAVSSPFIVMLGIGGPGFILPSGVFLSKVRLEKEAHFTLGSRLQRDLFLNKLPSPHSYAYY